MESSLAGRLAPVAALVEAARRGDAHLAARVADCFPAGLTLPAGIRQGLAAVWGDTCVVVPPAESRPSLSFDHGEPVPMTAVPGTGCWLGLATVVPGKLHTFRYLIDGEWSLARDVAGFNPLSYELPDA